MRTYGESHTGLKRKTNQDSFSIMENKGAILAMVCDGIGGGNAGDVASKLTVEHMQMCFMNADNFENDQDVKLWLMQAIQECNDLVFTKASNQRTLKGMGTTIVGVLMVEARTYIFNAGDSRTYGLYHDDFLCLTEDHSYVADLLKRGVVSIEEAANHPNRNLLTNALGIWNTMRIDINKIKEDYDALLICSDGLHGYVEEALIVQILQSDHDVKEKVHNLIQKALDAGGFDNITAVLIEKEKGE